MAETADQAQALRWLVMESAEKRARTIAVTSGKGGVGKTSVSVNLAVRLSRMGRRVILLDADLGTANADVVCNITPNGTLAHVVAGRKSLSEIMIDTPGGFKLIPGASGLAQMAALSEFERARLLQQMHEIEQEADIILIDTGAGVNPNVLGFALAADQQLVVTTPEPTAITDAYAVIKTISRSLESPDIRILVNMVRDSGEGQGVYQRISCVCQRFLNLNTHYAGHVKIDPRVSASVRQRSPFMIEHPNCDASECIGQLAHRMDRHATDPKGAGLLRRMAMWLAG